MMQATSGRSRSRMPNTRSSKSWQNPHPLAYAFESSGDINFLKNVMKEYCLKIQQVQQQSERLSKNIFSEKSPKKAWKQAKMIENLAQAETQYRDGFLLAKYLWQLETTMFETYLALAKWRRSTYEKDLFLRSSCNEETNDSFSDKKFLQMLQREEDESFQKYQQCGYDQAHLSAEIERLLGISRKNPSRLKRLSFLCSDDNMVGYTLVHYCQCSRSGCFSYFNKKDASLFGQLRVCRNSSSPNEGKRSIQSKASVIADEFCGRFRLNSSSFGSSSDSSGTNELTSPTSSIGTKVTDSDDSFCSLDRESDEFGEFYCHDCIKMMQNQERNTDKGQIGNAFTTSRNDGVDAANTDTTGNGKSIDVETGTKAKRRRKRKKKKTSKLSSSKDSKAETYELQVNACSSHTVDKSETTSIVTDPNELWVNYLWKTGSIIALDKYMDDMEKTLGNEILV